MIRRRVALVAAVSGMIAACGGSGPVGVDVVRIEARRCGVPPVLATGVAVGPTEVVTVAHAVADAHTIVVDDGTEVTHTAQIQRIDEDADLAILTLDGDDGLGVDPVEFADPVPGPVTVETWRGSLDATVVRTVTLRDGDGDHRGQPGAQLTAEVTDGDSGAPVVDRDGRVVAIVVARSTNVPDRAWSIRSEAVETVLAEPAPSEATGAAATSGDRPCDEV